MVLRGMNGAALLLNIVGDTDTFNTVSALIRDLPADSPAQTKAVWLKDGLVSPPTPPPTTKVALSE
jgi:hypothetical protein